MNQINETKSWLFEKVNKIKLLKALTRKKKQKTKKRMIPKLTWKVRNNRITRRIQKKNKVGGPTLSNFQTYHKTAMINITWYYQKNRHRSMKQNRESRRKRFTQIQSIYLYKEAKTDSF